MNDGMLLQINRQRNLIPEDRLRAAQSIQENERATGKTPRPLLDILATRGDLDSTTVRLIRTLMHRGITDASATNGNGGDPTIVEGFHALVESVILPPPEPSKSGPSKSGWPQEVIDAEGDLKNLFGQFVLVAQVGSGGSGTVYRAWDRRVSRYSGLKILHTMEPSALERFTREARIAGNLQHPSIATIYEVGEQDGRYYIAMKYIDGRPIDADPRSIPECLALIRDACRALDYAHKQGIIHRDVKPANLLVDSQDRVYVTDFGIAKQAAHDQTSTLSMTGTIIGTPKYLPPEQARGEAKRADARSDVYSIGATLYTLLAGRAPFPSSNVWETLESVMKREPPPLRSLNAAISPELERIIAKAMAKEPANRFASAGELADELDRILQQRRYTGRYGLLRFLARKWVVAAAAGVIIGALLNWKADAFFSKPKEPEPVPLKDKYGLAAGRLMRTWDSYETFGSRELVAQEVARSNYVKTVRESLSRILKDHPRHVRTEGLRARADYLLGKTEFPALDDYRIAFFKGLIQLENRLDSPELAVPLPSPEAPSFEWLGKTPKLEDLAVDFIKGPTGDLELLDDEAKSDGKAIQAIQSFLSADTNDEWSAAAAELKDMQLPVFRKAFHLATYFSRNWSETLKQGKENKPWHGTKRCSACLGAQLGNALAPGNPAPIQSLESLRKNCAGDASLELLVLACMARRSVERGLDPASVGAAADRLPPDGKSEMRGVLRVAGLRWKALSGADIEDEYAAAFAELQDASTWMGRLARIEGLLSLARRLKLRNGDFQPRLKDALQLATSLVSNGWDVKRVLCAEAYLLQGNLEKAQSELPSTPPNIRAHLVLSETFRRLGRFREAMDSAKRALEAAPEHPEALYLEAAAALAKAESDPNPSTEALHAAEKLSTALDRVPGYVEARFARACALFLIADWDPMSKVQARMARLAAEADLENVLKRIELAPARKLLNYLLELKKRD